MAGNTIETTKETLVFKILCSILESDAETVAKVLSEMPNEQTGHLIELALNAETEEQLDMARTLFNSALNKA